MGRAIVVRTDYTSDDVQVKNAAQVRRLLAIAAVLDGRASWATSSTACQKPSAPSTTASSGPRARGSSDRSSCCRCVQQASDC